MGATRCQIDIDPEALEALNGLVKVTTTRGNPDGPVKVEYSKTQDQVVEGAVRVVEELIRAHNNGGVSSEESLKILGKYFSELLNEHANKGRENETTAEIS